MQEDVENLEVDLNSSSFLEEEAFEVTLRPRKFDEYIGQAEAKDNLKICIEAAKRRGEPLEHVVFYGPPGLGKTTLAGIIASEMSVNIRVTSGPAIERSGDLASILTNLQDGDILFIDEIHRLNRNIEEVLYPAMEDFAIDLILGKGPSARTMRIDLPKFTLVGATTKVGALSAPLRDRFGLVHKLEFYTEEELILILKRASKILNVKYTEDGLFEIARRSRRTPRIAIKILKRVRDYAEVKHTGVIDKKIADIALSSLSIDKLGLDKGDREYLTSIIQKFSGGPVGLDTIAASISEDKDTIECVIEPYLLQIGFIDRTKRGRIITPAAFDHLKLKHSLII